MKEPQKTTTLIYIKASIAPDREGVFKFHASREEYAVREMPSRYFIEKRPVMAEFFGKQIDRKAIGKVEDGEWRISLDMVRFAIWTTPEGEPAALNEIRGAMFAELTKRVSLATQMLAAWEDRPFAKQTMKPKVD